MFEDWSLEAGVDALRGGRKNANAKKDAMSVTARTPSMVDPSMLLLRKDFEGHAKTRRKSVTTTALPDDDRAELEDCWAALLGGDRNGSIDATVLLKAADLVLGPGNYSEKNIRRAFTAMDVSDSGQVEWIMFRAFMTSRWNIGKDADSVMWKENRNKEDDMYLVDGSMRLVDMIKAYRRRTLVERALRDAQGQLNKMDKKRGTGTAHDHEDDVLATQSAPQVSGPSNSANSSAPVHPSHRGRRASSMISCGDDAGAFGKRSTGQATGPQAMGGPSRLRRAQDSMAQAMLAAESDGAAGSPSDSQGGDWLQAPGSAGGGGGGDGTATTGTGRILPLIAVSPQSPGSTPSSPPIETSSPNYSRFVAQPQSPLAQANRGDGFGGGSPSSTNASPLTSPGGPLPYAQREPSVHSGVGNGAMSRARQATYTKADLEFEGHSEDAASPPAQTHHRLPHGHSNAGGMMRKGGAGAASGHHSNAAPAGGGIKQDISSGFGRLAKFFWKSSDNAPAQHAGGGTRLPKI